MEGRPVKTARSNGMSRFDPTSCAGFPRRPWRRVSPPTIRIPRTSTPHRAAISFVMPG